MHTPALLALALLAVALPCVSAVPLQHADTPHQRAAGDLLETLRRIIREGNEDLGIPVLDPFTLTRINGSIGNGEGEVVDLRVTGLSDLDFGNGLDVSVGVLQLTVKLGATIPELVATTNYDFDTVLQINGGDSHFYGDGTLKINLKKLSVNTAIKIKLGLSGLSLSSLDIELGAGDIDVRVTGLLWGGLINEAAGALAEEVATELFDAKRPALEAKLEEALRGPLEAQLEHLSWNDLLCILLNQCSEDKW